MSDTLTVGKFKEIIKDLELDDSTQIRIKYTRANDIELEYGDVFPVKAEHNLYASGNTAEIIYFDI